jgi:biopolymer transport protein ExbB
MFDLDYMQKGGPLMWLILLCSVIAAGIFAERATYFHRASIRVGEFLRGLANLIQRHNYAEALHECAGTPGPVARVIHAAIIRHEAPREELKEIVQEAGQLEMSNLERNLGLLTTAAGLVVAIPAFAAYSYLSSRVNSLMRDMERGGIEIVSLITGARAAEDAQIIDFKSPRRARSLE